MTSETRKTTVIGLVGGIASGKSFAASILRDLGAMIVSADEIGHEVLKRPLVVRRLVQEFGEHILVGGASQGDSAGNLEIDRAQLAELVFGSDPQTDQNRRKLEAIVHPLIHAEAVRELRRLKDAPEAPKVVVVDAPLLLEAGWEPMCDFIFFLDAPLEVRQSRAAARGWMDNELCDREAAQMSLEDKRQAATHFVRSVDAEILRAELTRILQQL